MMISLRSTLRSALLLILAGQVSGQLPAAGWLSGLTTLGFPTVFQRVALDGSSLETLEVPISSPSFIIPDPRGGRVVVADPLADLIWRVDPATGRSVSYPAPGLRAAARLADGSFAIVSSTSAFGNGTLTIGNLDGLPWASPLVIAPDPAEIEVGGDVIWIRSGLQGSLCRVEAGAVSSVSFAALAPGWPLSISALASGGVAASFPLQNRVVVQPDATSAPWTVVLPEPLRIVSADGDRTLWGLGTTQLFAIDLVERRHIQSIPLPPGIVWQSLHADVGLTAWLEESTTPSLRQIDLSGNWRVNLPMNFATSSGGDPFGYKVAAKVDSQFDDDGDGVANAEELRRGTSFRDPNDVAPLLFEGQRLSDLVTAVVIAPSHANQLAVLLLSLDAGSPVGLGPTGGAPYFAMPFDILGSVMLDFPNNFAGIFFGLPFLPLDAAGMGAAGVDLSSLGVPVGTLQLTMAGAVLGSSDQVVATTNSVTVIW